MLQQEFYLVVSKAKRGWQQLSGHLSTRKPALDAGEVAIKLTVKVPDALFTKPQLQATVTIPESAVTRPVLDANVLDNVREVLEQQTGMDISVRLVEAA